MGGALGVLGLAYGDSGRFDEAIDCLEQSPGYAMGSRIP